MRIRSSDLGNAGTLTCHRAPSRILHRGMIPGTIPGPVSGIQCEFVSGVQCESVSGVHRDRCPILLSPNRGTISTTLNRGMISITVNRDMISITTNQGTTLQWCAGWMSKLYLMSNQNVIMTSFVARNRTYYPLEKITELGFLSTTARRQRSMTGSS